MISILAGFGGPAVLVVCVGISISQARAEDDADLARSYPTPLPI